MPITLPPISRRRFLGTTLAAGAVAMLGRFARADDKPIDLNRVFLLSDTHVNADPKKVERGTSMYENMKQVCGELLAAESRASNVIINGDCAHSTGETGDYTTLLELLKPVREGKLPVHLGMGNHDNRENVWKAFDVTGPERNAVEGRHISVIKLPNANVILLDSLDKVNSTPGVLGEKQIAWLGTTLDAAADKPAIVMVHHQPDERTGPKGITDTKAFLDVILPRKQVKLLLYGHTHNWDVTKRDDLHCVNLPPVGYVFAAGKPNGWVDMKVNEKGATLELRCIKADHPEHKKRVELAWR